MNQILKDYIILARHLRRLPSNGINTKSVIKSFIYESDSSNVINATKLATLHAYAQLVSSQAELQYLRSLDSGEKLDPRDKIKATARRVGLEVPEFSDKANHKMDSK